MSNLQKRWLWVISFSIPMLSLFVFPFYQIKENVHTLGFPFRFLTHYGYGLSGLPESRLSMFQPSYFMSHISVNILAYFVGCLVVFIFGFILINRWNFREKS